mmetsp:Transcript_4379/g.5057  ORF Transcript_4379/g.5057 Transcript_4379/m.5057 type:complete len:349 (-) Transcript_4379:23-1069(-)
MNMRCLPYPPPKWINPPPAGRGRGTRLYPPPRAMKRSVGSRTSPRNYTPILQKRASYISRMQQQDSSSCKSLFDMKSPVSKCIDTIIGAAEAVNRRDAWLEGLFGDASKRTKPIRVLSRKPLTTLKVEPNKTHMFSNIVTKSNIHDRKILSKKDEVLSVTELEKIFRDKELCRNVVLMMALERPRKEPATTISPSLEIGEGFYWKEYPILENILFDQMAEYYQFSSNSRQSKSQQAYNNLLVEKIRSIAASYGYSFDPTFFNDKRLRDRVRCFYKTHLQNAKKRLSTMQKHVQSKEQRRILQDLIIKTRKCIPKLVSTFLTDDEENKALASVLKRREKTIEILRQKSG